MSPAGCIVLLSALIPLVIALSANRSTSLIHALCWAIVAWIAWFAAFAFGLMSLIYLALALTVCAGVAVLGARRPGSGRVELRRRRLDDRSGFAASRSRGCPYNPAT